MGVFVNNRIEVHDSGAKCSQLEAAGLDYRYTIVN